MQQTLWNAFMEMDKEFNGNLASAITRDRAHLLVDTPTIESPHQTGLFAAARRILVAHLEFFLSKVTYPSSVEALAFRKRGASADARN